MIRFNKLLNFRAVLSGFGALMFLASCSSYQYAGYDSDGIYAPSDGEVAYTADDYEESYQDALYYKQLFAEKADDFEEVPEEGAIFTDIEGYSSEYDDIAYQEEGLDYQTGHPAWGTDPDRISINIYEDWSYNPFYNPYINPYYAGFYDPFLSPGYGYAYNPYGYAYGYGYGYPYGYRYGYYNPWGWNRWGHRYSPYYYGGRHYENGGHYLDEVAYSSSRRNSYYDLDKSRRADDAQSYYSRIDRLANGRNIRALRTDSDDRKYTTRARRVRSSSDYDRGSYARAYESRSSVETSRNNTRRSYPRVRRSRTVNYGIQRSSSSTRRSSAGRVSRSSRGRGN